MDSTFVFDPALLAEVKRMELFSKRAVDSDLVGQYRSAFRGSGLLFSELREYSPGDDIKHIHWKASARTDKVFVKSYHEDRHLRIVLAVDISRSTGATVYSDSLSLKVQNPNVQESKKISEHEKALQFVAVTSILANKSQDSVGVALFSDKLHSYLPPSQKRSQPLKILNELSKKRDLPQKTDLAVPLRELAMLVKQRSVIFIISDFFSPSFEEELTLLTHRHDVILTVLYNPPPLPDAGLIEVTDAESGERIILDTSSEWTKRALLQNEKLRMENLRALAGRTGADIIQVTDSVITPLAQLMRERSARQ